MTARLVDTIDILVPVGALGAGISEDLVQAGIVRGCHAIACDAGSTDSGPAYLATGLSKYARAAIKADLAILMRARARARVPLLIGSCGTSGCDLALDSTCNIALEIKREENMTVRIALLRSEVDAATVTRYADDDRITELSPMRDRDVRNAVDCDRIVALMGPEPFIAALDAGADIVLGGRTTDSAVIAAMALRLGGGRAAAWHAGKTAECGGQCTVRPRDGGVMVRVGPDAFEVEPLSAGNRCTPESVSAHMLYENTDPFRLIEPGGILDVTGARYVPVDGRTVLVEGSRWQQRPYTTKLEGAGGGTYQTIMLIGIQAPDVLAEIDAFVAVLHARLTARVEATFGEAADGYDISLRAYGHNAVSGLASGSGVPAPREVGLLFVATAATQDLATQIAKTCNPWFFHMSLHDEVELPSYAFPFSPAEIERGQVFEFKLNHVIRVDHPLELVRMELIDEEVTDLA